MANKYYSYFDESNELQYVYKPVSLSIPYLQHLVDNNKAILNVDDDLKYSSFSINDNKIHKVREFIYNNDRYIEGEFYKGYVVKINELSPIELVSEMSKTNFVFSDRRYLSKVLFSREPLTNNKYIDGILDSNNDSIKLMNISNFMKLIYNDNISKIFSSESINYIYIPCKAKPCPTHIFKDPNYGEIKEIYDFVKIDVRYIKEISEDVTYALDNTIYIKNTRHIGYKSDILYIDNEGNIDTKLQRFVITDTIEVNGITYYIIGHPNMIDCVDIIHNYYTNDTNMKNTNQKIMDFNMKEIVDAFNDIVDKEPVASIDKSYWKPLYDVIGEGGKIDDFENQVYKLGYVELVTTLKYYNIIFKFLQLTDSKNYNPEKFKDLVKYVNSKYNENAKKNVNLPCENIKYQFQIFVKNDKESRYQPAFLTQYDLRGEHTPILDRIETLATKISMLFGIRETDRYLHYVKMGDVFTVNSIYMGSYHNVYEYNHIYSTMIQLSVLKHYVKHNLYLLGQNIPSYKYRNYKLVKYGVEYSVNNINLSPPKINRTNIVNSFGKPLKNTSNKLTKTVNPDNSINKLTKTNRTQKNNKLTKTVNSRLNNSSNSVNSVNSVNSGNSTNKLTTTNRTLKNINNKNTLNITPKIFIDADELVKNAVKKTKEQIETINTENKIIDADKIYVKKDIYFLTLAQLQAGQYEFTARIGSKYYYGILRPNMIPKQIIEKIKLTNRYEYIKLRDYEINILEDYELFKKYQPYRLTYIAEINNSIIKNIGIQYYDIKGLVSTFVYYTENDPIYSNHPFISLKKSLKPDDLSLNEYERAILNLKFIARSIIDLYTFIKGNQLKNNITFNATNVNTSIIDKLKIVGSKGKLTALISKKVITNKLGTEKFQVDPPGTSNDNNNIDLINKNCIWFFDSRFMKYMENKAAENLDYWNDKCINLMDNIGDIVPENPDSKLYNYFLNDYSALTPEHCEDLKEIVNELCIRLYGSDYKVMKNKLCIKFHNFGTYPFKVLHLHMGPDSNYYNYENLNKHNIIRHNKNLLIEDVYFGLNNTNFTFDGMYTSKFSDYYFYI